jgi:hypothetical protein
LRQPNRRTKGHPDDALQCVGFALLNPSYALCYHCLLASRDEVFLAKKSTAFDLFTFVAGAALDTGKPFSLRCNCDAVVTIMPPFQDEYVVCPRCEATIRMLVLEGDPGYIIGAGSDGNPTLLPVQGSSKPHPNQLSKEEREAILAKVRENIPKKWDESGQSK